MYNKKQQKNVAVFHELNFFPYMSEILHITVSIWIHIAQTNNTNYI
mgnify:CR=1 FL=1